MATKEKEYMTTCKKVLVCCIDSEWIAVRQRVPLRMVTKTINPVEAVATEEHLQMILSAGVGK